MPVTSGGAMIAPFADEAMRLLRETWANPTMLAEEVFAILQQKIPQRANTLNVVVSDGTSPAITLRQNGDGPFILMQDRFGHEVAQIGANGRLRAADPAQRSVSRVKPTIVWANPADITQGTALSGTQLNAVAVIPDTAIEIDGVFEYSPDDGTVLSTGTNQSLNVNFTPTNQSAYKRARKTVTINVNSPAITLVQSLSASATGTVVNQAIAVASGNLILVFVAVPTTLTTGITFTISDTQGNSYSQAGTYVREAIVSGSRQRTLACFWAVANATNTVTVTSTLSATPGGGEVSDLIVMRFSGTHPSSPIVAVATNHVNKPSGFPYTMTTTSVAAAGGNTIVVGFQNGGTPYTYDVAYTSSGMSSFSNSGANARHENVSGSEAATATASGTGDDAGTYNAIGIAIGPP